MLKKFYCLFAALLCVGIVSCGGNDDPEPDPVIDPVVTPDDDTSKPKEYFETTAELFMNYFNAKDQKSVLELVGFYCNNYAEYEVEGFEDEEYDGYKALAKFMKKAQRAIATGHFAQIKSSDLYCFADYSGVYEPNDDDRIWERTGDNDNLVFKFSHYGAACELKVVASNDKWSVNIGSEDTVEVPKTLTITLTEGNSTLLSSTVKSDYNASSHTLNANTNTTVANINVTAVVNGTDSKITANQTFTIGGKTIQTAQATITGNNLCDRNKIEDAIENEDENALKTFFTNATGESDILGRVQIKAEVTSLYQLVKADDDRWDAYEEAGWSNSAEEEIEKTYANTMNNYVKCSFYFAGKSEKQGDIIFKAIPEEYYSYTYWDTYMVLQFSSDNSTYEFEQYFGDGNFHSTETLFTDIVDTYISILNID